MPTIIAPLTVRQGAQGGAVRIAPDRPAGAVVGGKPAQIMPAAGRSRFEADLFIPGSPHNIPNRANRPAYVGYNGITPVTHILGGTVIPRVVRRAPGQALQNVFDEHHYAKLIESTVSVTQLASPAAQLILDVPDGRRNALAFRNVSATANIYIGFGQIASANSLLRITPNTMILYDSVVPQDALYAFADAASGILAFHYSNVKY